ncbi:hypothetical protein ACFLX7_03455 [Chloroflexota bacterium]
MIGENIDFNILVEAEVVAATYAHRKPDNINISDIEWLVASDETRMLLIRTQQLAEYLCEAYMEAEKRGNREQTALLYHILEGRRCLLSIDPNINEFYEYTEREVQFTVSTRSWIQELKALLQRDLLQK